MFASATDNMAGAFLSLILLAVAAGAVPTRRQQTIQPLSSLRYGDLVFDLNGTTYLGANTNPVTSFQGTTSTTGFAPVTVIKTDCSVSAESISAAIDEYLAIDDVFSEAFLYGVILSSDCIDSLSVDVGVSEYLTSIDSTILAVVNRSPPFPFSTVESGPYLAEFGENGQINISKVYRLCQDCYRDFLYGTYPALGIGTYQAFPSLLSFFEDPLIPVPSRMYSLSDTRPLAGLRVAVKDLYDLAGTKTSAGSRAWTEITSVMNTTAPAIQRIIDLGGIIIGKQKMAQFASGADPWDWYDVQYPFNPRGDGWLTCSASSSGAGCSIAAYDWLDIAIGSDTGSSVRRPASVSGTFGNRPSQGMISLEGVNPLGAAQDTAGLFSRDPALWSQFAKQWYIPPLHQDPSINGLEALSIPDSYDLPKFIKYDPAYLPVRNPAAAEIMQQFLANMTSTLNMTIQTINLTSLLLASPIEAVNNVSYRGNASSLLNTRTQWVEVADPLLTAYAALYDGRFPPIDPARRPGWVARTPENVTDAQYDNALQIKRNFSEWMNHEFLGNGDANMGSCADSSIWVYDIGTGGLPSYREQPLLVNNPIPTARLNYTPPGVIARGVDFCSFAGCADYTVPIGQVEYFSNVTRVMEMVPVTVSLVAKRGCDFVLFNVIEKLPEFGVLSSVKTGRSAF